MIAAIGVDGCPDGWIAVGVEGAAGPSAARAWHVADLATLLHDHPQAVIAIDMPIGFADGPGGRGCDAAARPLLGPRRSSVFTPPCRAALRMPDYDSANRVNRQITGKGLSKQAWAISPKMREIDDLIDPGLQDRVIESHPELAFTRAAGAPMAYHKSKLHGLFERLRLLHRLDFDPAALARDLPASVSATPDDLLDACILAHVAQERVAGRARVFPDAPLTDARGLRMEMWA